MDEALNKSIDSLIDTLFLEPIEKSASADMLKDQKPAKETADEALAAVPKAEKDENRNAGRPKQISDIPQNDQDGSRSGEYDSKIASPNSDTSKKEDSQIEVPSHLKKSLSEAEYAEYLELKKAKAEKAQEESLAKARREQSDLIKSAVVEATAGIKAENAELRKSLAEQSELIKSIANRPQPSKAVTAGNVQAVEKFAKSNSGAEKLSKSEILDVAEELVKSKHLTMEHVIELENNSFIYDSETRSTLEKAVKRKFG